MQQVATKLIGFFNIENGERVNGNIMPLSLAHFIAENPDCLSVSEIRNICHRLENEGFMFSAGFDSHYGPILNERFFSMPWHWLEDQEYGLFEFVAFGFPYIRDHFQRSVVPIIVKRSAPESSDPKSDIGTGFLIESNRILTAAHCVKNMRAITIQVQDRDDRLSTLSSICVPTDDRIDLAVLQFQESLFPDAPNFKLGKASLLDDVLTMGYPSIPGFHSVLISERAQISGHLKASVGQVVNRSESYLDRQPYLLITARVKGGNSGGPVINRFGKVVGVVASLPAGEQNNADTLGFGVVIPSEIVSDFIQACESGTETARSLDFEMTEDGIQTEQGIA